MFASASLVYKQLIIQVIAFIKAAYWFCNFPEFSQFYAQKKKKNTENIYCWFSTLDKLLFWGIYPIKISKKAIQIKSSGYIPYYQ